MPSHRIAAKAMIASCLLLGSLSPGTAPAAPLNRLVSFSKKLCDSNAPGARCDATQPALPTTFTVVSRIGHRKVNQLVIEFVSGVCVGDGRADYIAIASTPDGAPKKNPDAGDNFSNNYFYFTPNQYIAPAGSNGVQILSQISRIYLSPGDAITLEHDSATSGVQRCVVELNGHYDLR